jgi:UDP-2,4-diacetamido-2,4,6-trideoxy-beta-L-altropyranose hydrolase
LSGSHLFVLMAGALPVGQIRFDVRDGVALIDYSLDRLFRGRGWASRLVTLGLEALPKDAVSVIRAEVRQSNLPSVRVFERLDFKEVAPREGTGLRAFELAAAEVIRGGRSCA